MATIITRETGVTAKGSPLTNAEMDSNLININDDKLEADGGALINGTIDSTPIGSTSASTGKFTQVIFPDNTVQTTASVPPSETIAFSIALS